MMHQINLKISICRLCLMNPVEVSSLIFTSVVSVYILILYLFKCVCAYKVPPLPHLFCYSFFFKPAMTFVLFILFLISSFLPPCFFFFLFYHLMCHQAQMKGNTVALCKLNFFPGTHLKTAL